MRKRHSIGIWRVHIALAILLLASGCGGNDGQIRAGNESPAAIPGNQAETGPSIGSELPAVDSLDELSRSASELLADPLVHVSPQSPSFISSGISWGSAESMVMQSPPVGASFAMYAIGELHRNDRLISISANADSSEVPSGQSGLPPFEYYVLLADYNTGKWVHSEKFSAAGPQSFNYPIQSGLISPGGYIYIAVICSSGSAVHVTSLDAQLDISARAVDHVIASMPGMDSTGVDIHYSLQVVDASDQPVDFNGTAELASTPDNVENVIPVQFVNGKCDSLMRFSAPALYDMWLVNGSVPGLNSYLGGIEVYTTQLPVYEIFIDPMALQYITDNPWDNTYQTGSVTVNGKSYFNVGLRFRGDSARWLWKKNWKVKFAGGQGYDDTEWGYSRHELNLNAECVDPTMMREKLSYQLMEDMGMMAPRARFIHVRVNHVFQGLYCDVEDPNKQLINFHGVNDGGSIYKPAWNIMEVLGDGTAPNYVGPFEKKTREAEPYDDLALLIWNINNVWNPADCSDAFKATFDEEAFMKYMVANTLCSDGDQLGKNYVLYNEDIQTGQWMVIPWDYDLTWGHHYTGEYGLFCEPMFMDTPLDMGGYQSTYAGWRGVNNLLDRYVYDPILFDEFKNRLAQDMEIYFQEGPMIARINQYYDLVKDDAHADWQRWVYGTYEDRVQELRDYVVQRRAFLTQQLSQ